MKIKTGKGFEHLAEKTVSLVSKANGAALANLRNAEFSVGFSKDADFGVPSDAADTPIYMGDSAYIVGKQITATAEAQLKADQSKIQIHPVYDPNTGLFEQRFAMPGDAGFDPIAGQLFSPWNITYLSQVWKQPMTYTRAHEVIKTMHAGTNPFAEIFTLFMRDYAGWGAIGQTGSLQNTTTNDVNVMDGMMSFNIINMMGTYSVTLEEQKRSSWGPAKQSPLADKQKYLNYVMNMMDAILIYYGNEETETKGLLDINPIRVWEGKTTSELMADDTTSATRGSIMFNQLARCLNDFLTSADNKYQKIKIAMCPQAYNDLMSMTYSTTYDSTTAMEIFRKSYLAGMGPNGSTPSVEFIAEPLLKPNTEVNANPFDYMVITCPEIGAGPENETQPTNFYATVLDKFVFPVIPGMYNHQYKTLRRVAGVVAPIPDAVRVYSGFCTKGDE